MAGYRIKPLSVNGPAEVKIDLEALMEQPSRRSVMQELRRQTGSTSSEQLINLLAIHEPSGELADVNYASIQEWSIEGRIPYRRAAQIEAAVEAITGRYEPFLSRFYKQPN